jgi:uncharacterized protein with HEPN domain
MRPEERDAAYLWDMLDAARAIGGFIAGVRAEEYAKSRQLLSLPETRNLLSPLQIWAEG